MSVIMDVTTAYFDSINLCYNKLNNTNGIVLTFRNMNNIPSSIDVFVIFDDNDHTISLRCFDICKIPAEKKDQMFKVCNDLNERFRWIKFYVEDNNDSITAEDDAVVQPDSAGEEIFELIKHMFGIVDDAYPDIMKTIWS